MATWKFTATNNGGKKHNITVKASSKPDAIKKGFEKARKNAIGDIYAGSWDCKLLKA